MCWTNENHPFPSGEGEHCEAVEMTLPIEPIETLDDPRVELYRNVKERDLQSRSKVFLAEGELVVRRLIEESRFSVHSVLLNEARLRAMSDTLSKLERRAVIYLAPQKVFDEIVGYPIHRGVLAAGVRPEQTGIDAMLDSMPDRALVVVMEDLANHDNVGGVFRCGAAFGVDAVLLSPRCADPLYRKATRVSIGSTLTISFARTKEDCEIIQSLHAHNFETLALTPGEDAADLSGWLDAHDAPRRVALLLGAEGDGLRDDTLRSASHRIRMGKMVSVDSLNVVVAAGIALHAVRSHMLKP
jgi:tRNA G18 (ribose-2'-O)-methylase SpoU